MTSSIAFVAAASFEIAGCFAFWTWLRGPPTAGSKISTSEPTKTAISWGCYPSSSQSREATAEPPESSVAPVNAGVVPAHDDGPTHVAQEMAEERANLVVLDVLRVRLALIREDSGERMGPGGLQPNSAQASRRSGSVIRRITGVTRASDPAAMPSHSADKVSAVFAYVEDAVEGG